MSIFTDDSKLIKAIEFQIKGLVDEEIDKIIEQAKADVETKLRKQLAQISLELFKCFEVSRNDAMITIRVRNEL